MKKFKNRKNVKNVKNVNNTVKNNANMDGFEELVKAAKEFNGALDDEVANREYEHKKLAEAFEKKASNDAKAKEIKEIMETATATMRTIEDIINGKIDEQRKKSKFLLKPYCLEREDFLTYNVEKSKKNKTTSEVESLKAELENLNAHFKGVCAERDNLAACLKSCEKDLKQKQDEAVIMRQEAVFQFKRAEKAEAFIKQIDGACDLIKKHIAAYGSKKKSK